MMPINPSILVDITKETFNAIDRKDDVIRFKIKETITNDTIKSVLIKNNENLKS